MNSYQMRAKATPAGYFVLAGPHFLIGFGFLALFFLQEDWVISNLIPFLICSMVGLIFCIWLNGRKIFVNGNLLVYRNGFYKRISCDIPNVKNIKHKWIHYQYLWRRLEMPRLVIRFHDRKTPPILINAKPFSRSDLEKLEEIIDRLREGANGANHSS